MRWLSRQIRAAQLDTPRALNTQIDNAGRCGNRINSGAVNLAHTRRYPRQSREAENGDWLARSRNAPEMTAEEVAMRREQRVLYFLRRTAREDSAHESMRRFDHPNGALQGIIGGDKAKPPVS